MNGVAVPERRLPNSGTDLHRRVVGVVDVSPHVLGIRDFRKHLKYSGCIPCGGKLLFLWYKRGSKPPSPERQLNLGKSPPSLSQVSADHSAYSVRPVKSLYGFSIFATVRSASI